MTMQLIETKTLGAAAASIEFTSIPQTFTDLYLLCSIRTNRVDTVDGGIVRFNDITTGYTGRVLLGTGSSTLGATRTIIGMGGLTGNLATSNTFSNNSIYIPNYTSSNNKSVGVEGVTEHNESAASQGIEAGHWNNSAAINKIAILPEAGTQLLAGSTISLYGITKGSDGIVTTS
jgi:hypothetical protein